jgi:transcriptional regulator with XRE-family HTH domain
MPGATLKDVAKLTGVAPVTVSRVVNGAENVKAETREKILSAIREVGYMPNVHAASLRRQSIRHPPESARQHRVEAARKRLSTGQESFLHLSEPVASRFSSERKSLAKQITRLRRDLNLLMKHAQRIQTFVDTIKETCSDRSHRVVSQ